jgi:hypothetical protein
MKDEKLKIEIFKELSEKSLESALANTLFQSSTFIDKILIELSDESIGKQNLVKNLINLNLFIKNSVFEYKIKQELVSSLENKKKDLEKSKELKSQKGHLAKDQSN